MNRKIFERPCKHCKQPFIGNRMLKYCGPACRETVHKKQNAEYERRVKRHTYRYRKQLELPLDKPGTAAYGALPEPLESEK